MLAATAAGWCHGAQFLAGGTVTYCPPESGGKKSTLEYTIYVRDEKWLIRTRPLSGGGVPYEYHEAAFDGTNLYRISVMDRNLDAKTITANNERAFQEWLKAARTAQERAWLKQRFANLDASATNKPANKAVAKLTNERFPRFDLDLVAPVWLAYGSSTFFGIASNRTALPRCLLAMVNAQDALLFDACEMTTTGADPDLPATLSVYQASPANPRFLRFRYEAQAFANAGNLTIPSRSEIKALKAESTNTLYSVQIINQYVESAPRQFPEFRPDIPVQTHVSDFRFNSETRGMPVSYHILPPNTWPAKEVVPGLMEYSQQREKGSHP